MATISTRPIPSCPECGKAMAYDIRHDEYLCSAHGRFWETVRGTFQKAPPLGAQNTRPSDPPVNAA